MRARHEESELRRQVVGDFLRERRLRAGLTQWDVAQELRYSTAQFISNWERGVSLPPLDTLPVLARLLSASAKEVIAVMTKYQTKMALLQRQELERQFEAVAKPSKRRAKARS